MIRWYWQQVGETLIEEFCAVERSGSCSTRLLDAVIIKDGPFEASHWRRVSVKDRDIVVVQAKVQRLGMYLMGQTLFSASSC
jgi:hypothetical protein